MTRMRAADDQASLWGAPTSYPERVAAIPEPTFDGETYSPPADSVRLRGLLARVRDAMLDGEWWTLRALSDRCGGSEASVSARIRDLRKEKFGSYRIDHEHVGGGLWRYRMVRER